MYEMYVRLPQEIDDMKFLVREVQKKLGKRRLGTLSVKKINGHLYYYETKRSRGRIRQRYLGTESDERLGEFIILKVLEERLRILKDDLVILQDVKRHFRDYSSEAVIRDFCKKHRIDFWSPAEIGELDSLQGRPAWEVSTDYHESSEESKNKTFTRDVITCDGRRVRSKGECIIYLKTEREYLYLQVAG